MKRVKLHIADRQSELTLQQGRLWEALEEAARQEDVEVELSLAVVHDREMKRLNDRFLDRDETTDVLSFGYDRNTGRIEGEVIINASEAIRQCARRKHSAHDELMLYAVHGLLHLIDYNDLDPDEADIKHRREAEILRSVGRPIEF